MKYNSLLFLIKLNVLRSFIINTDAYNHEMSLKRLIITDDNMPVLYINRNIIEFQDLPYSKKLAFAEPHLKPIFFEIEVLESGSYHVDITVADECTYRKKFKVNSKYKT